jgi:DNA polymerase
MTQTVPPISGPISGEAVAALLRWYADMGVDEITGTQAINRYVAADEQRKSKQTKGPAAAKAPPPKVNEAETARTLAARCSTLDELRSTMENFDLCPLKATANHLVFADGQPGSPLMVIGEAPGQEEDRKGLPFVGRSGILLDRMLEAIGITRETCYISNILPWRPPLNRKPELSEIHMCLPFLMRHIELAAPKIILTLGGTASQHLLETQDTMKSLRGRWRKHQFGNHEAAILATYHPAYLLRNPISKRAAWSDMIQVKLALEGKA